MNGNPHQGDSIFAVDAPCSECSTTVFYVTEGDLLCPVCLDREARKANAERTGMMHEYHGYSREK